MPSWTSTVCNGARFIWEYERASSTRRETRPVASASSVSNAPVSTVVVIQRNAAPTPGAPTATSTSSSQRGSAPAAASGLARSQPCSTPRASSHVPIASSRSMAASAPVGVVRRVGQPSAQGVERRHRLGAGGQPAERGELRHHRVAGRGETLGGPHRGCRRIVQLVRKAGPNARRGRPAWRARAPSRRCCGSSRIPR